MTNTDKELFRILNDKLNGLESPVSADVWNGVQHQMSGAAKAATVKSGFWTSKLIIGLTTAAVITGVVLVAVINTQKSSEVKATNKSIDSKSQMNQNSGAIQTDTTARSLNEIPSIVETATYEELVISPSDDIVPYSEDQRIENEASIHSENQKESNNATDPASKDIDRIHELSEMNTNQNAEPLSAGFHTRCVDAEDLRYFFFPKTDKAQSFKWSVSDGSESAEMSLAHVFEKEGTYTITLTATGYDGQITTESESIQVYRPVIFKIPTAITPGNSGKNDAIDFTEAIEHEKSLTYVVIQDKQGNVVYESKNVFTWNGYNMKQELCSAGVYSYVVIAIDGGNNSHTNKGTIQLFHE
ncbi:MAG: PKD domain-containing protein [Flavobacteriales bacterium]